MRELLLIHTVYQRPNVGQIRGSSLIEGGHGAALLRPRLIRLCVARRVFKRVLEQCDRAGRLGIIVIGNRRATADTAPIALY
jgi:hypothetical protein